MRSRFAWISCLGGLALTWGAVLTSAASSPPPLPDAAVEALERFYHTFNGDNWRRNDGWLDPDVDPCDWRGVSCGVDPDTGQRVIEALVLPGNNLVGNLHESDIMQFVTGIVHLPDNRIGGFLDEVPVWLQWVDLSNNQLSGGLPEVMAPGENNLRRLHLGRNRFELDVPGSWSQLQLEELDLSGNLLEGTGMHGFAAMNDSLEGPGGFLDLSDNRLAGALPPQVMSAFLAKHNDPDAFGSLRGGGLNLCWNDLEIEDPDLDDWIGTHHVGGGNYRDCLMRQRVPIDPRVSGSWYDPGRSGEGVVLQLLPDGRPLLYAFTFDTRGRQHWLVEVGRADELTLHWPSLASTRGEFGQGKWEPPFHVAGQGIDWRMDRTEGDRFHVERVYMDLAHCTDESALFLCGGWPLSDRLDYLQLTRLAGTSCDNHHPQQWISGAWYDPERSGEGFMVEVIEDGRGLVYWMTHLPDESGLQAWMVGDGEFMGNVLHIPTMVQPVGGRWGDEFDSAEIERIDWGSLTLEFFDDSSGQVFWDSLVEGFGTGEHPIQRLSRPLLAECEADS